LRERRRIAHGARANEEGDDREYRRDTDLESDVLPPGEPNHASIRRRETFCDVCHRSIPVARDDAFCMKPCSRGAILTIVAVTTLFSAMPASADNAGTYLRASQALLCAPADEYFGPLGLSVLGIRNQISETSARLDRAGVDGEDATHGVALVEESVRDWESKYPRDTWLPRTVLALHRVYRRIANAESLRRSVDTASWLIARYPQTAEARAARGELADAMAQAGELPSVDVSSDASQDR
jgi:hypothetical protein